MLHSIFVFWVIINIAIRVSLQQNCPKTFVYEPYNGEPCRDCSVTKQLSCTVNDICVNGELNGGINPGPPHDLKINVDLEWKNQTFFFLGTPFTLYALHTNLGISWQLPSDGSFASVSGFEVQIKNLTRDGILQDVICKHFNFTNTQWENFNMSYRFNYDCFRPLFGDYIISVQTLPKAAFGEGSHKVERLITLYKRPVRDHYLCWQTYVKVTNDSFQRTVTVRFGHPPQHYAYKWNKIELLVGNSVRQSKNYSLNGTLELSEGQIVFTNVSPAVYRVRITPDDGRDCGTGCGGTSTFNFQMHAIIVETSTATTETAIPSTPVPISISSTMTQSSSPPTLAPGVIAVTVVGIICGILLICAISYVVYLQRTTIKLGLGVKRSLQNMGTNVYDNNVL